MTNDIYLKGFWPPEAKVAVDFGKPDLLNYQKIFFKINI
jgi:hypothetical protein